MNGLGNLVARILKMSSQYLDNTVDISHIREMPDAQVSLEKYEFNHALDSLWSAAAVLDSLIQEQKPFEVFKADRATAQKQVSYLVQELARIAKHLEPFMPETSRKIEGAILANTKPENLFPRLPA